MHNEGPPRSKVFYHPLEAAVRWAGLLRYESLIMKSVRSLQCLPRSMDCPRWGECRLYAERIYDGIVNSELPFGKNGITLNDDALLTSPELTIRHINLKRWMRTYYPEHRPGFLFSRGERMTHPFITVDTVQAILTERLALRAALGQNQRDFLELQEKYKSLLEKSAALLSSEQGAISDRAEATYLHIIGSMLALMLGQSPSGMPYSNFKTQEAIVSALVAHHDGVMGITERTLNGKFATARRRLHNVSL
ncbi:MULTISPECIES: hypothetical protein [Alcaligenaceae]|uniref:Receptor protein-tyrosine kinase n=1 Tax=Eoetvoesiella caeni TaxID=645616 RepID=A0A366H7D2_9BURK|nr:hypothetical protein [Eoetvoesiella caeni]MCI2810276.1 hypothetical protein [Eoetvoesiella caeni]NYT54645.1 hypothetical protein [Eoetvoesiella caeni]RBP37188.1 hypothetical protein DFR37_110145 [Eoetvoesiella caeni]